MGCLWCLIKTAAILLLFCFIVHLWVSNKDYMFSEEEIASVTRRHIGPDAKVAFNKVHTELLRKYPGHILPKKDLQWVFVNAGGWMGSFCLLHASVTEYVLFFGTPITTEGHSGRYWANISDTVVTGTFRQWIEGSMDQNVFKPGDTILHAWGEATAVNFEAGTWMVEYGRGFIPSTLGFALADTIFSTQDFLTMFYTFRIYTKAMWQEAAANLVDFKAYVRDSL